MNDFTRTFSGAHPYRPQCVITAAYSVWQADEDFDLTKPELKELIDCFVLNTAEHVTTAISNGQCPRCSDPLLPVPVPVPDGWKPAGTRALPCRCVPVCETCATWIEPVLGPLAVTAWPTDRYELDNGSMRKDFEAAFAAQVEANCQVAYLEAGATGPVLMSEAGISEIQLRPSPGGWLEHGYDDTADIEERQS